jgi:hypothetical protein
MRYRECEPTAKISRVAAPNSSTSAIDSGCVSTNVYIGRHLSVGRLRHGVGELNHQLYLL